MPYHPFDLTKVWPKEDYPLIEVGVMELNRNPANYFAEVEQGAFAPANVVPGISFSPDKMLQARLFSYGDAQRYRLGVNHHQIPVNCRTLPGPQQPPRRRHAGRRQLRRHAALRAQQLRRSGRSSRSTAIRRSSCRGDADFWNFREDDDDYYKQPG